MVQSALDRHAYMVVTMRDETDKHRRSESLGRGSDTRPVGVGPDEPGADTSRSTADIAPTGEPPVRPAVHALKFVGKEAASAIIKGAALVLAGAIVLTLGLKKLSIADVFHAISPYWDEFAIALAGFLVGVVVCLPRLLVARRVVKRSATQEQAALEQAALASDLEQQEFYRSALREAFPDKTIDWLRGDAPPTTWLREETLGLERIVTGKSALSVSWDEPHPETLRRGLVDGIIDLWAALGPPSPSPEYPQVMVATTSRTDCLGRARSVLDAYQLLATTLNPARRLSSQRCQSERNPR